MTAPTPKDVERAREAVKLCGPSRGLLPCVAAKFPCYDHADIAQALADERARTERAMVPCYCCRGERKTADCSDGCQCDGMALASSDDTAREEK